MQNYALNDNNKSKKNWVVYFYDTWCQFVMLTIRLTISLETGVLGENLS